MTWNKELRDFAERYRNEPGRKPVEREEDDPPHIVEEIDAPAGTGAMPQGHIVPRKCKVHRTRIEGITYTCRDCGSVFCLACITNVLLPEGKCMVCDAPVEINDEFRSLIDRATHLADTGILAPSGQVTTIAPEIWRRFEELELEEDVVDEIIDRLKYVPPEDRLKYLDAYFNDEDEHDDPL
jgi:hypothetical protein